jgi:hypothetical protein
MSITSTGLGDPGNVLVVTPRAACLMLSCSRKRLYQLLADGELISFTNGRSRRVTVASIKELVARGIAASAASKLKRPT